MVNEGLPLRRHQLQVAIKRRCFSGKLRRPSRTDRGAYGQSIADVNAARSEVGPNSTVARVSYDIDAAAEKTSTMEVATEMATAETSAAHMNAAATTTEVRTKGECGGRERSDRQGSDGDES